MATFGTSSKRKLKTCHPLLQLLFNEVIKGFDCSVLCGHRTEEDQRIAYEKGNSKVKFPNSKHNSQPSIGIGVAPYPINWKDIDRHYYFAGYVRGVADRLGIPIRYGGDWDDDMQVKDENFKDLVHFELVLEDA